MGRLIDALLGAFGFIKKVRPKDEDATWEKFVVSCKACKRLGEKVASFILTGNYEGSFMPDGIKGATGSSLAHALTCFWENGDKVKDGYEIVESQTRVAVDTLLKFRKDGVYLVGFSVSLNDENFDKLKKNAYSQIGKPYDVAEFLKYLGGIFDAIPNPSDLHVCSTLTAFNVRGVYHRWFGTYKELRLWPKKKKPNFLTPGDLWDGMNPQFRFRRSFYNCK